MADRRQATLAVELLRRHHKDRRQRLAGHQRSVLLGHGPPDRMGSRWQRRWASPAL
jgi:hypothetical protein